VCETDRGHLACNDSIVNGYLSRSSFYITSLGYCNPDIPVVIFTPFSVTPEPYISLMLSIARRMFLGLPRMHLRGNLKLTRVVFVPVSDRSSMTKTIIAIFADQTVILTKDLHCLTRNGIAPILNLESSEFHYRSKVVVYCQKGNS